MHFEFGDLVLLSWIVFGLGTYSGLLTFHTIRKREPYVGPPPFFALLLLMMGPALPVVGFGALFVVPILMLVRKLNKPKV